MNGLVAHVGECIRERGLFAGQRRILVAVSGGLDSLVLLRVLHALAPRHRWRLTAAHFNHRLRGRSSDADERLVVRTCKRLDVPVVVGKGNVRSISRKERISIEMAARKARHDFFARAAKRRGIRCVALAHHADDQLELFFLRLFRGSGSEGLSGMKWRGRSPSDPGIELVRPLLNQPKAALLQYAAAERVVFREDASNASLDILRNRIRLELLPWLRRRYQPALDQTTLRVMDITGAEAEFVNQAAAEWLSHRSRPLLGKLPVAVQRRSIQLELLRHGISPDYDLVEALRTRPDRPVTVSPDVAVILGNTGQISLHSSKSTPARVVAARVALGKVGGQTCFDGMRIRWRFGQRKGPTRTASVSSRETFDADRVGPKILLRHWRPGDRFQPIGMPATVKLQNLFTNLKIPRAQRHDLVVATTMGGEIFWVERLRISERFKLTEATIRCLQWCWNRL